MTPADGLPESKSEARWPAMLVTPPVVALPRG